MIQVSLEENGETSHTNPEDYRRFIFDLYYQNGLQIGALKLSTTEDAVCEFARGFCQLIRGEVGGEYVAEPENFNEDEYGEFGKETVYRGETALTKS